jgi:hypothetical protein
VIEEAHRAVAQVVVITFVLLVTSGSPWGHDSVSFSAMTIF